MALAAATDLERLVRREHSSPHDILGAHATDGGVVIRAFRPAAAAVRAIPASGHAVDAAQIPAGGGQIPPGRVFAGVIEDADLPLASTLEVDYAESGVLTVEDPYRFLPT